MVDKISAAVVQEDTTTGEDGSQRHDIVSRLDAVMASLEMTRSTFNRDVERTSFSAIVDKFVKDTNSRIGITGLSKETLHDGVED